MYVLRVRWVSTSVFSRRLSLYETYINIEFFILYNLLVAFVCVKFGCQQLDHNVFFIYLSIDLYF